MESLFEPVQLGGPGSGDHGHSGRPGEVGGSGGGGGGKSGRKGSLKEWRDSLSDKDEDEIADYCQSSENRESKKFHDAISKAPNAKDATGKDDLYRGMVLTRGKIESIVGKEVLKEAIENPGKKISSSNEYKMTRTSSFTLDKGIAEDFADSVRDNKIDSAVFKVEGARDDYHIGDAGSRFVGIEENEKESIYKSGTKFKVTEVKYIDRNVNDGRHFQIYVREK